MSDDSFIREVNEELRSEQMKTLWRRFGPFLIGAAIVIVIGTIANVTYTQWSSSRAAASGDQFIDALELAASGQNDQAMAALEVLEAEGYGSYPALAQMRMATLLEQKGDAAAAVSAFDTASKAKDMPQALRNIALLRAGYILVDSGSYDDVASRVETMTSDNNPLRNGAREALGLAAWKAGRFDDAAKLFRQIADDNLAPANMRQRANVMLDLMRGSGALKQE